MNMITQNDTEIKPKHKKAFMDCAEAFSKCSNATRLKVGAVIVKNGRIISCGYNAQPKHINDPCELATGDTDPRVRHAEKSALMGCLKAGISPDGATMFVTHSCCQPCAIDILDSGVREVIYRDEYRDLKGIEYLKDHGVKVEKYYE